MTQRENPSNLPIIPIQIPHEMPTNTTHFKTVGWRQDSILSLGGENYEFAFSSFIESGSVAEVDQRIFISSKYPLLFRLFPGAPLVSQDLNGHWNLRGVSTDQFDCSHGVYSSLTPKVIEWIKENL